MNLIFRLPLIEGEKNNNPHYHAKLKQVLELLKLKFKNNCLRDCFKQQRWLCVNQGQIILLIEELLSFFDMSHFKQKVAKKKMKWNHELPCFLFSI